MRLLKAKVTNFGSYDELAFDFDNQGLALVYGNTGSGKSTLQDIAPWIMFGVTAKDGNSDDVRSWTNDGAPTIGILNIAISDMEIEICRVRGNSKQNDLYWIEDGLHRRGKDLPDTQKLLNERLGVDPYLYTVGAYYNEFSPTGSFFTAKASARRDLFEQLVDLSLPVLLTERISHVKKEAGKTISSLTEAVNKATGSLSQLERFQSNNERDATEWEIKQKRIIEQLQSRHDHFKEDQEKKELEMQSEKTKFNIAQELYADKLIKECEFKISKEAELNRCESCGIISSHTENRIATIEQDYMKMIERELSKPNPYVIALSQHRGTQNPFGEQIASETTKTNPFLSQKHTINCDIITTQSHNKDLQFQLDSVNRRANAASQLHKIVDQLRGELLRKTIKSIETESNRLLEAYFDAEIRVVFTAESTDKIDVLIWKSGHECSYKQLSKGQRSLLKLAFSVSVMSAAANKAGVHFDTVMFDESLDGLDSNMKLKAFNLFCELAKKHSTVLVIDHSEGLQNLFDKKYCVTIDSDISSIKEI